METQNKTPVEIVQELLALHTTRKEAAEKLQGQTGDGGEISAVGKQSDEFISELMNELSNYGDAVGAGADRENEYQMLWKKTLSKIDSLDREESADIFQNMEESLKKIYQNILETKTELPVSLQEILSQHAEKL